MTRKLQDVCRPGLVISVLFPNARRTPGLTLKTVEYVADSDFFTAIEIAEVNDAAERAAIAHVRAAADVRLVYWLSMIQFGSPVSISSPDEAQRKMAVAELIEQMPNAMECGAEILALNSGRDVPPELRGVAVQNLVVSVCELAEAARQFGLSRFTIETMDRDAHKKYLIGPTEDAIEFLTTVRRQVPDFHMGFDTAHIRLLDEDPFESLQRAREFIGQIHLANCVSDRNQAEFGDNHMMPGAPGFLDEAYAAQFLQCALHLGVLGERRPTLSVEVAGDGAELSWSRAVQVRKFLEFVWQRTE